MTTSEPVRARDARWRAASDVLRLMRSRPGITRSALARELRLTSGTATDLMARLRDLRLVAEAPAPIDGRGRPTTILQSHPAGPLVLAMALSADGWTSALAGVDGEADRFAGGPSDADPQVVIRTLRSAVMRAKRRFPDRLTTVSVAVAGTLTRSTITHSVLGWDAVDLGPLVRGTSLTLLAGNDATLAALAEARRGAARGAQTALHLLIDVGIGGALTIGGQPLSGRTGASGEYGHMPFGDPDRPCPCGASGCWELDVDGRALARRLGEPAPANPHAYALAVLARDDEHARAAVEACVATLARGIAGLVNAHDPDVVTLGMLAPALVEAAPDAFAAAYRRGLMALHRADPPPVVTSAFRMDGSSQGAIDLGLDYACSPTSLDAWAASVGHEVRSR